MRKERLYQLIFITLSVLFVLVSFLVNVWLGEVYMFLLFLAVFCMSILIFSELYLRVQWNVDRRTRGFNGVINRIDGLKNSIEGGFQENKQVLNEIVDFFESLLKYLEEEKGERRSGFEGINDKFEGINDKFEGINDKFEGINDKFEGMNEFREFQEKLVVIVRQILEYQKEQTNFLNKEFEKLKNGSKTRKK